MEQILYNFNNTVILPTPPCLLLLLLYLALLPSLFPDFYNNKFLICFIVKHDPPLNKELNK